MVIICMCVCCVLWSCSDSWRPSEGAPSIMFCPPHPAQPCGLTSMASFMESTFSYLVFLFPYCFLFSLHYCLSQRTLPSHDVPQIEQLQFCHYAPRDVSGFICSRAGMFVFLAVQGAQRGLFRHYISSESHFPQGLLHYLTFVSVHVTVRANS